MANWKSGYTLRMCPIMSEEALPWIMKPEKSKLHLLSWGSCAHAPPLSLQRDMQSGGGTGQAG